MPYVPVCLLRFVEIGKFCAKLVFPTPQTRATGMWQTSLIRIVHFPYSPPREGAFGGWVLAHSSRSLHFAFLSEVSEGQNNGVMAGKISFSDTKSNEWVILQTGID